MLFTPEIGPEASEYLGVKDAPGRLVGPRRPRRNRRIRRFLPFFFADLRSWLAE